MAQYFASGKLSLTESMTVKLLADNDFYSQRQNVCMTMMMITFVVVVVVAVRSLLKFLTSLTQTFL
ncbi:hypothetical protein D3C87_2108510 [compost metagenome]